jgi:hypothetical protein
MKENKSEHEDIEKNPFLERDKMYSEDGVDISLIRWMLSLTPTERLMVLQSHIELIEMLRDAKSGL